MKIKVTEEHIRKGIRASSNQCAIALALKEVIHSDVKIQVDSVHIAFWERGQLISSGTKIETEAEIFNWIRRFDQSYPMEPIELNIEIPQEFLKIHERELVNA